jgi:hypothetical protein
MIITNRSASQRLARRPTSCQKRHERASVRSETFHACSAQPSGRVAEDLFTASVNTRVTLAGTREDCQRDPLAAKRAIW